MTSPPILQFFTSYCVCITLVLSPVVVIVVFAVAVVVVVVVRACVSFVKRWSITRLVDCPIFELNAFNFLGIYKLWF